MRTSYLLLALALAGCSRLESTPTGESCRRVLDTGHVQWSEAADSADRRTLDHWCQSVGPAVVLAPLQISPASVPLDSIAVVSWNTRVGGADIERFVRDLRAGRFTDGDSVRHFVLLLQEVYRSGDDVPAGVHVDAPDRIAVEPPGPAQRRDIVATAHALGLGLLYVPSMRNGIAESGSLREDRGNAILSTLELFDLHALELPFEVQRRVALLARVNVADIDGRDWQLTLVSVHLDTRSRLARLHASTGAGRRRQAQALVDATRNAEPIVVGGDFNTWAPLFLERAIPLLINAFSDTPQLPVLHTFENFGFRRRLDYLFVRLPGKWKATYQRIDARYGSDHYPLLGWIHTHGEER